MKLKTCKQCENKVEMDTKYCPKCGGKEFIMEETALVPRTSNPTLIHRLFYWDYDGYYTLSKSKLAGMATFIFILSAASSTTLAAMILVGAIVGLIIFLVGFLIHNFLPNPEDVRLKNNDYGLVRDFINFLFFWQNKKTGEYVLSKTKIITGVIFVLVMLLGFALSLPNLFAVLLFGLVFAIPAFVIGSGVHKLTNPNPVNPPKQVSRPMEIPKSEPKVESNPTDVIPEYAKYKVKIEELTNEFNSKEKQTRELIEKRFAPPQLTYTRFISVVDKSGELFKRQSSSALTMIDIAAEYSSKIESEILAKIEVLDQIIDKLEDLTNELVLSMDDSNDEDINNLFDDMSNLIQSVKEYE